MKIFFKKHVLFGLLLVLLGNSTLFTMEEQEQRLYKTKDILLHRLVGMEGKLEALKNDRLTDFVTFSLQQVDAMRQLAMNKKCDIEFLNTLVHDAALFELSRDKFIQLDKKLFNLRSIFESLRQENLLHIIEVEPNLQKILRYLEQLENLKCEDCQFWPFLFAVDEDVDSLEFVVPDNDFMDRLEKLFTAVVAFENELNREQVRSGEYYDDGCDDDFDAKNDRRGKYSKKMSKRKQRRADAAEKSHR
jgi:hypothetical protein